MSFVVSHGRIYLSDADRPARCNLHGFAVHDIHFILIRDVDEQPRACRFDSKRLDVIALKAQLADSLVGSQVNGDEKGITEADIFAASDHVQDRVRIIDPRRVCSGETIDVFYDGIIGAAKDLNLALVAIGNEYAVGFRKIKNGMRRTEACDALHTPPRLEIKYFHGFVVFPGEK